MPLLTDDLLGEHFHDHLYGIKWNYSEISDMIGLCLRKMTLFKQFGWVNQLHTTVLIVFHIETDSVKGL